MIFHRFDYNQGVLEKVCLPEDLEGVRGQLPHENIGLLSSLARESFGGTFRHLHRIPAGSPHSLPTDKPGSP